MASPGVDLWTLGPLEDTNLVDGIGYPRLPHAFVRLRQSSIGMPGFMHPPLQRWQYVRTRGIMCLPRLIGRSCAQTGRSGGRIGTRCWIVSAVASCNTACFFHPQLGQQSTSLKIGGLDWGGLVVKGWLPIYLNNNQGFKSKPPIQTTH